MKKYTFKIIGTGLKDSYQVNIKIFEGNKMVDKGKSFNGIYKTVLKENSFYKIVINNCSYSIVTTTNNFYININNNILRKFILTDQYYIGLPIKKGVLILCQNR